MEVIVNPSYFVPSEIVHDIFQKLRTRSLYRFRCLSKAWYNILRASDQEPAIPIIDCAYHTTAKGKTYISKFRLLTSHGVEGMKESKYPILEFSFESLDDVYYVWHVAFGILLFATKDGDHPFLCNPLREEILELPQTSTHKKENNCYGIHYGMGFDRTTNTYKIVRIFQVHDNNSYDYYGEVSAEVYTLGTKSWRRVNSVPPCNHPLTNDMYGVCAYGDVHWGPICDDNCTSISFDIKKEEFKSTITIPHPVYGFSNLFDFKGSLGIYSYFDGEFEVWVLKDYNGKNEWVKEYTINNEELAIDDELDLRLSCSPIAAVCSNGILIDLSHGAGEETVFIDLEMRRVSPVQCQHLLTPLSYTAGVLSLKQFGNSVPATDYGRNRYKFLKSACSVYYSPTAIDEDDI